MQGARICRICSDDQDTTHLLGTPPLVSLWNLHGWLDKRVIIPHLADAGAVMTSL